MKENRSAFPPFKLLFNKDRGKENSEPGVNCIEDISSGRKVAASQKVSLSGAPSTAGHF